MTHECCRAGKEKDVTQKDYYDYREEENTRQVSLMRLLRCALMRWKMILLAGIVLGALLDPIRSCRSIPKKTR